MKVLLNSSKNQQEINNWTHYRQVLLDSNFGLEREMKVGGVSNKWCCKELEDGVPSIVQIEINGEFLSFWLDTLCCAELVNLRVASTLQHRWRSYSIHWKFNQKFVIWRMIGKCYLTMIGIWRGGLEWGMFWINDVGENYMMYSPLLFKLELMVSSCHFD